MEAQQCDQGVALNEGGTSSQDQTTSAELVLYRSNDVTTPNDVITLEADMSWCVCIQCTPQHVTMPTVGVYVCCVCVCVMLVRGTWVLGGQHQAGLILHLEMAIQYTYVVMEP